MSQFYATRTAPKMNAKQIDYHIEGDVLIAGVNLAAAAGTVDISAPLTTAVTGLGRNGTNVPHQVSANIDTDGWVIAPRAGLVQINNRADGSKIEDNGNEVYARLTEAAGVYTLTFNTSDGAGGDQAVNLPAGDYDFIVAYNYPIHQMPPDALRHIGRVQVAQDAQVPGLPTREILTIATLNTVPNLATAPRDPQNVTLNINQGQLTALHPGITVSAAGAITWDQAQIGFDLETTDHVVATYYV